MPRRERRSPAAVWRAGRASDVPCRLELQGEFHQGICDVSGGFVGDGVIGGPGFGLARHGGRSIYSSISSFMRKLLPSMMTVSA